MIDLSIPISFKTNEKASKNEKMVSFGHLGTHFDIMDFEFPLEYTRRQGIVFNVYGKNEIDLADIEIELIKEKMLLAFYSGFINEEQYGTAKYFSSHPQLSVRLIETILAKRVSLIGVDFAGIRRGNEHAPMDKHCADRGVFIIENLCNLDKILRGRESAEFRANIYPINFTGISGLPCRVTAEVD